MKKRFEEVFKQPFIYRIKKVSTPWTDFASMVGNVDGKDAMDEFNKRMLKEHPSFTVKECAFDVYVNSKSPYSNEVGFIIANLSLAKPLDDVVYFIDLDLAFKVQPNVRLQFDTVSYGYRILEDWTKNLS